MLAIWTIYLISSYMTDLNLSDLQERLLRALIARVVSQLEAQHR